MDEADVVPLRPSGPSGAAGSGPGEGSGRGAGSDAPFDRRGGFEGRIAEALALREVSIEMLGGDVYLRGRK